MAGYHLAADLDILPVNEIRIIYDLDAYETVGFLPGLFVEVMRIGFGGIIIVESRCEELGVLVPLLIHWIVAFVFIEGPVAVLLHQLLPYFSCLRLILGAVFIKGLPIDIIADILIILPLLVPPLIVDLRLGGLDGVLTITGDIGIEAFAGLQEGLCLFVASDPLHIDPENVSLSVALFLRGTHVGRHDEQGVPVRGGRNALGIVQIQHQPSLKVRLRPLLALIVECPEFIGVPPFISGLFDISPFGDIDLLILAVLDRTGGLLHSGQCQTFGCPECHCHNQHDPDQDSQFSHNDTLHSFSSVHGPAARSSPTHNDSISYPGIFVPGFLRKL